MNTIQVTINSCSQNERVRVEHLALERPSTKSLSFMRRHYDLEHVFKHPNAFVTFEGFFDNRSGTVLLELYRLWIINTTTAELLCLYF